MSFVTRKYANAFRAEAESAIEQWVRSFSTEDMDHLSVRYMDDGTVSIQDAGREVERLRFAVGVVPVRPDGKTQGHVNVIRWDQVCPGDSIKGPKGWFEVLSVNVSGGTMVEIGIKGRTVTKNVNEDGPLVARGAEGTAFDLLGAESVIETEGRP